MSSDEALKMETLPSSIIIVGGGVIGIEWASMLADFGVEVTVIEYADRHYYQLEDKEISKEMQRLMKKKGIKLVTGAKVLPETLVKDNGVTIQLNIKVRIKNLKQKKFLFLLEVKQISKELGLKIQILLWKKDSFKQMNFFKRRNHIFMQLVM